MYADVLRKTLSLVTQEVELIEPDVIKWSVWDEDAEEYKENYSSLGKEAAQFIYNEVLDFSLQVSKKVYKLQPDIWKNLVAAQIKESEANDTKETLYERSYLKMSIGGSVGKIVGTVADNPQFLDNFNTFFDYLESMKCDVLFNDGYAKTVVIGDSVECYNSHISPVLLIDMDFKRAIYTVNCGALLSNDMIVALPKSIAYANDFESFICVDLQKEMDICSRLLKEESLLNLNMDLDTPMSVREVMQIMKDIGVDKAIVLDEYGYVSEVPCLNPDDSSIIIEFLNSFKLPYASLKSINSLRKSLKFDHLTVKSMLEFLTQAYACEELKITGKTIVDFCIPLFKSDFDKIVVESELHS